MSLSVDVADEKWTDHLSDEDCSFIKRFVLASGSLKAVAAEYRITYPTVRLRLDRLIAKIELLESLKTASEFERQIRVDYAEGRLDLATMKRLLAAHRRELARHERESG